MYKCSKCKETFLLDELYRIDCNEETYSVSEYELELNAQNPDYCVGFICEDCFIDDLELENK